MGYKGALYAWESADTGEETTPEHVVSPGGERIDILTGRMEHHVSADVAYAVWQYWRATDDDRFFIDAGAEILLETARFWASRAMLEADGKRHIRHVIGPDEYHEDVDDNAFTNVMARWNIARGLETIEVMRARWPDCAATLWERLALREPELADWRDAVGRIVTGFDLATGPVMPGAAVAQTARWRVQARRSATAGNFGTSNSFAGRGHKLRNAARISFVATLPTVPWPSRLQGQWPEKTVRRLLLQTS